MLTAFGPDIWIADGPTVTAALGFRYPTRMALIRLADGGVLAWSPVALSDALRRQVADIGPVRHIVAPNTLHDTFLTDWQSAYPDALLHAAPGLRPARRDIRFGSDLGHAPHADWRGQIDQVVIASRITTEVILFHRASGTAIVADLLQHLPGDWFRGWRSLLARADLMTGPEPAVPRKFRAAIRDRPAARTAARRILGWGAQRLIIAHGPPVERDAAALLSRAFGWLRP